MVCITLERISGLVAFVVGVLSIALPASATAAKANATSEVFADLPAGLSYELAIPNGTHTSPGAAEEGAKPTRSGNAWIPVTLKKGALTDALVTDVALGDVHDKDWLSRFDLNVVEREGGTGLELTVNLDAGLPQGSFGVSALLLDSSTPPKGQPIALQIQHPAAVVRAPKTLRIERVRSPDSETRSVLTLRETGLRSWAWPIRVRTNAPLEFEGEPLDSSVELTVLDEPAVLDPNGSVKLAYQLSGDLPLGRVSGTLEVSAPQLASAFELPFVIETRRSCLWLLGVLLVGIVAGHLVRHYIDFRIAAGQAREPGVHLLGRIEWERNNVADAGYAGKLDRIHRRLFRALQQEPIAMLPDAVTQVEADFKQAREAWAKRLQAASAEVDALAELLGRTWDLPPSVEALRAQRSVDLQQARARLAARDASGASAIAERVTGDLQGSIRRSAARWRLERESEWSNLEGRLGKAPSWLAVAPADLPSDLATKLAAVSEDTETSPVDLCQQVHEAWHALREAQEAVRRHVQAAASGILRFLRAGAGLDEATLAEAEERRDALARGLDEGFQLDLNLTFDQVDRLDEALVRVLEDGVSTLAPGDQDAALDLIRSGRLSEAAATLTGRALRPVASQRFRKATSRTGGAAPETQAPPSGVAIPTTPDFHAALREEVLGGLARAKLLRTALLGIPIIGLGYALFADAFLGTPTQLGAAFLWSYGIDVTADSLAQLAKPLVAKAKATG